MYEAFYGLQKKPFSILPDPEFIYWAGPHSLAFAMLEYGVASHAGFTVITGEVGSGKTTLIRWLLQKLPSDVTVGFVPNMQADRGDLLQWIMMALHQESDGLSHMKLYQKFEEFLLQEQLEGRRTVLIIDEAQTLGVKALEELRLISNVNALHGELVQIVLTGQPELKALLSRPELVQFAQRVSSDFHLNLLGKEEIPSYINHRLAVAGVNRLLFSDDANDLIFLATLGTPRLINVLCDTALNYGFAIEEGVISASTIYRVLDDKRKYGVFQELPTVRSVRSQVALSPSAAEISRRRPELEKAVRKIEPASVTITNPTQAPPSPKTPPSLPLAPVRTPRSEPIEGNDVSPQPVFRQTNQEASPDAIDAGARAIEPLVAPPTPGLARTDQLPMVDSEPAKESGCPPENILCRAIQEVEVLGSAAGAAGAAATEEADVGVRAEANHHGGATAAGRSPSERSTDWAQPPTPPRRERHESLASQPADHHDAHDGLAKPRLASQYFHDGYNNLEQSWAPPAIDRREVPNLRRKKRAHLGEDHREVLKRDARRSWSPALLLIVLISAVILGAGTVAWSNREMIGQIITALDDDAAFSKVVRPINPSPIDASPAVPVATAAVAAPAPPADERSEAPPTGVAEEEAKSAGPATPLSALAADKTGASGSPIEQKAILHEESVRGDSNAAAASFSAAVTWRNVENGANGPAIEADLRIPARRIKIKLIIHKNADSSISASHLIELMIDAPADLPGKGIQQVSQILMKPTEEARGQPLVGAEAKIVDGFFLIALSNANADVSANLALLRDRNWFDLPFVYETGQRAILTFEKGSQGDQVFQKALAAWAVE